MCDIKTASIRTVQTNGKRQQTTIGHWCLNHNFLMSSALDECVVGFAERMKREGKTIEDKAEIEAEWNDKRLTL